MNREINLCLRRIAAVLIEAEDTGEFTPDYLWTAVQENLQKLPYPPTRKDVERAAPKDVLPLMSLLGAMGRMTGGKKDDLYIFNNKELANYTLVPLTGTQLKGLVAKYEALLTGVMGTQYVAYFAGEQVKSGRGAFGRQGGSARRSGYNAASLHFTNQRYKDSK